MDGGSAYGIGNTLAVTGVAVTTGHEQAVIRVESVYDNVGDVIRVAGVSSEKYSGYMIFIRLLMLLLVLLLVLP